MQRLSRIIGVAALVVTATAGPAMAKGHQPFHTLHIDEQVLALENAPGPPVDCPTWAGWRFSSDGTGQMPHFGRYDMALTQCSHYPEDPPFGHSEGTTTFVAANGDKLVLAHTIEWETILNDVGDDDGFEGVGTWTVHDHESTGRFASARATGSGSITMIGDIPVDDTPHHDLPAGATLWTFDGEIEYRASDRSGK